MIDNVDVITLSSDEEEKSPPKKRVKLITIDTNINQPSLKKFLKPDSYIVLSDEEDENAEPKNNSINPTSTENVKSETEPTVATDELMKNETLSSTDQIQIDSTSNIIDIEEDEVASLQNDSLLSVDEKKVQDPSEAIVNDLPLDDASAEKSSENLIEINGLMSCSGNDEDDSDMPEKVDNNSEEFFVFIDDCLQSLKNPEHKKLLHSKLAVIKRCFEKVKRYSYNEEEFLEIIRSSSKKINNNPAQIIICFTQLYQWLKASYLNSRKEQDKTEQNRKIIGRLDKSLRKIRRKLRQLENAEINWDDEENSVYLQHARYSERAIQIYNKLCKYTEENPNQGRLVSLRLDFSASEYTEINRAINRKFKKSKQFPTYFDLDKLIRKCVKEHNLNISEHALQYEIKHCFEKLGKLLQSRRMLDSYQFLQDFLEDSMDPANDNPEIAEKIKENQNTNNRKLDDIFEKYSKLQEKGYEPTLSSDSDDSNYAESDTEEKTEEVTGN